jgi:hypothetical protein
MVNVKVHRQEEICHQVFSAPSTESEFAAKQAESCEIGCTAGSTGPSTLEK